jgi:hypothetical protein
MCIIRQGRENTSKVGYYCKAKSAKVNQNKQHSSQWVPCHVPNSNEMIMKSPCRETWKKYNGDDVCINVKQIENFHPKNRMKIVTSKKWLTMIPNWKHYEHPPITPPNLGANLTSFECHEPLETILKTSNLGNDSTLYGSTSKLKFKTSHWKDLKLLI